MNVELSQDLLGRLSDLRGLCPDMRFGQLMAALGVLAEDEFGRSLWDVEDDELMEVVDRFRQDLDNRGPNAS